MKISFSKQTKERAFKQLYEEYYAPFCLYAKRFVDDKETREDIVSDVFTSLWDKLDTDSFDLQSNTALAYIKMCVKNNCLNFLKHQEYEWSYAENIKKKTPIYETEPDSIYTLDELYRMLYETLDKLPENYRTVFMKSFCALAPHTARTWRPPRPCSWLPRAWNNWKPISAHTFRSFFTACLLRRHCSHC